MNYPMKDGRIDPEFLEKVHKSTNLRWSMTKSEVEAVLIYAQEVMQEMQSKTELASELERIIANLDAAQQEYNPHIDRIIEDLTKLKEAQHGEG